MAIAPTQTSRIGPSALELRGVDATSGGDELQAARAAVASRHLLNVRRANDPEQVKELKRLLKAKGYDVGDLNDGRFDSKVLAAVAQFQADRNLTKDGEVGQQTWAALLDVPNADKVPPGTAFLIDWNSLVARRGDVFVDSDAPEGVDLGANLRPENATEAPMFRQADPRWGGRVMDRGSVLRAKGCAVSAMAMALSGATGREINPGQLDEYLDRHHGYSGSNDINWATAGQAAGVRTQRVSKISIADIEKSLAAKRPVPLGVDYKRDTKTDHWITITSVGIDPQGRKVFLANDPATGGVVRLYPNKQGGLNSYAGGMGDYRSTGDAVLLG